MRLSRLLSALDRYEVENFQEKEIASVECDSRRVGKGVLFVAIPGEKADGAAWAADAVAAGAAAVVARESIPAVDGVPLVRVPDPRVAVSRLASFIHSCPSVEMQVVGITGTNGKTTTGYLLRAILAEAGEAVGLIGTVGCEYGIGDTMAPETLPNTTPGPVDLHRILAGMLARRTEYAVMEVSSHALVQHRVRDVCFDAAIYTNLSHEHLDYHGTPEAYLAAKAILFKRLRGHAVAVVNSDDEGARTIVKETKARVMTYGMRRGTIRGKALRLRLDGTQFRIDTPNGTIEIAWPLVGIHNIYNALAAAACAFAMGYDLETIRDGLEGAGVIPGRLERVDEGQPFSVLVDYAHTDDALKTVLANLARVEHKRILTVFGCGGDRDRAKRPKMGAAVAAGSDRFWITSDNPRGEDPAAIVREIEAGLPGTAVYETEPDRCRAIGKAVAAATEGDIVLIAGKGHEAEQIFAHRTVPFDDRAVARAALRECAPLARETS